MTDNINKLIDKLIIEDEGKLPEDPKTLKRLRKAYLDFNKEETAKYKKKPNPYTRKKIMGVTQIELATGGKVGRSRMKKKSINGNTFIANLYKGFK
tara:strand:- start:690 stop:977 length:288 start_codon:yes stop_codon:yes gene_type:complete